MAPSALLIGNSRWHWATRQGVEWLFTHHAPNPSTLNGRTPVWAAVGTVPPDHPNLLPQRRLTLEDVPLQGTPHWLGVDRALGAWMAWRLSRAEGLDLRSGLLLADAGTVLSLTLLTPDGQFRGGQLMPGWRLQMAAMESGTTGLQRPEHTALPNDYFPQNTGQAMLRGALQAMVGAVAQAQKQSGACVWICGGDGHRLAHELQLQGVNVQVDSDLVMKGVVTLMEGIS